MNETRKYDLIYIHIIKTGMFNDAIGYDQYGKVTIIKNGKDYFNKIVRIKISEVKEKYNYGWII